MKYRIKHLLLLMVVAALAAAVIASSVERKRRNDAYSNAQRQGWYFRGPCSLFIGKLPMSDRDVTYDKKNVPVTAEKVRALREFSSFSSIGCSDTKIDRPAFSMLVALPTESLSVADTNVDDLMMSDLRECRLRHLDLSQTLISDDGLKHLQANQSIESLFLESTKITDESVNTIVSMSNLRRLDIGHTNITEASLCRILESGSAKSVYCDGLRYGEDALNVAFRQGVELINADHKTNRGVRLVTDENGNEEFKMVELP